MAFLNITETHGNHTETGALWVEHSLLLSLFLGACFLIGVPGNSFVVWTILTKVPQRSFNIALILNLAVADLMALLSLPFWIYYFANSWIFGEVWCKLLAYLVYFTMYASIFLIMLMSLHRFSVVVLRFASLPWRRPCVVGWTLLAVWLSAGLLACPTLIFSSSRKVKGRCSYEAYDSDGQRIAVNIVETLFGFVLPFAVLSVCYSYVARRIRRLKQRTKMKTRKLITALLVVFFACWLPYHIFNLLLVSALLMKTTHPDTAKALLETTNTARNLHGALAFLSSCLNPILYAFAAQSFRGSLRKTNFAKLFGKMHDDTMENPARDSTVSMRIL